MLDLKIGILEKNDFSQKAIGVLTSLGEVSFYDEARLLEDFIRDKEVIFVRLKYYISSNLLMNAQRLKYICSPTTGFNHIDERVNDLSIRLLTLKGETEFLKGIRATAEYVVAITLALLRNFSLFYKGESPLNINKRELFKGHEVYKNTIGIIGMGRIGTLIARYFKCLGAEVHFFDINESIGSDDAIRARCMEELIRSSTIIILCADFVEESRGLINEEHLKMMTDKYFINAARGELVDEDCLISMLEQNLFSGVAIDVIQNETSVKNNHLKFIELVQRGDVNLIYTPHIGGATFESMSATEEFMAEKLKRILMEDLKYEKI